MQAVLNELASADDEPSLSKFLMREATSRQFGEFLVHRSLYHLKEADPHTWAIPRLSGSVKAAMVTIQADEYGGGAMPAMHAQLFRTLLTDWDLHGTYGHYLDHVPGVTLLATNVISMFGLHRRWRGALVGHLAMFEMTSSVPNGRYARGHRRLGGGEEAALFFDEHVVAARSTTRSHCTIWPVDSQSMSRQLVDDIIFGARCAAYADTAFARHVFDRWGAGASSCGVLSDVDIGLGAWRRRESRAGVRARAPPGSAAGASCEHHRLSRTGRCSSVDRSGWVRRRRDGGAPPSGGRAVSVRAVPSQTALRRIHRLSRFRDPATGDQISHVLNRARPAPTE